VGLELCGPGESGVGGKVCGDTWTGEVGLWGGGDEQIER
jgi:hypothetical protein